MAKLIPNETQGLGFGMFTFSGKATAFIGPVCAAALTFLFSQRLGFAFSIVLLLSGMLLMLKVSYKQIKN
jgi:UMF1 family MFS transporter